jgi:hypothetical protein
MHVAFSTVTDSASFRLAVGVALEVAMVTTGVAIAAANLPWILDCHGAGDCPSPRPWIMSDVAGQVAFILWFPAAGLIPSVGGLWARHRHWRRLCLTSIVVSVVVGTTVGMLLTTWLFPTAYAGVWHAPIRQWLVSSVTTTVIATLGVGVPALPFSNAWTRGD